MKSWLQKKWNNGKMLAELKPAFFSVSDILFYDFYICTFGTLY